MSTEYEIQMIPAVWVAITKPNGDRARVDVYAAHRALIDASRQPSPDRQMLAIRTQLASILGVDVETVAESEALQFNDSIVAIVRAQDEERKKKVLSIVCSPPPIPESPETSPAGQTS